MSRPVKFFIDTADVDYNKKTWDKLSKVFSGKELVGITTNPAAMAKVNADTMEKMGVTTKNLCKLVTDIRRDTSGVVYVQGPSSKMTADELFKYAQLVESWSDGFTKVGLKIVPHYETLANINYFSSMIDINVTGVADCSTALRCFSHNVRYVSIIPGRMEERGVNAKEQISFVNERKKSFSESEIITGSMRTIEGLAWAIEYDTVPTVGSRVFDQIFDQNLVQAFKDMWAKPVFKSAHRISPLVTQDMLNLSNEFFDQMDQLGAVAYKDWSEKYLVK